MFVHYQDNKEKDYLDWLQILIKNLIRLYSPWAGTGEFTGMETLVCSIVSQLVLYSYKMQTGSPIIERSSWPKWANFLRSRRLDGFAAWVLEAAGPLTVLGAQAIYLGSPLLRPTFSTGQVAELANLLEDSSEAQAFVAFLQET